MSKHTPGPWLIAYETDRAGSDYYSICSKPRSVEVARSEEIEDATLIAAAPELLDACRAQQEAIDRLMAMLIALTGQNGLDDVFLPSKSGQPWEAVLAGNAAIAKAEGAS